MWHVVSDDIIIRLTLTLTPDGETRREQEKEKGRRERHASLSCDLLSPSLTLLRSSASHPVILLHHRHHTILSFSLSSPLDLRKRLPHSSTRSVEESSVGE